MLDSAQPFSLKLAEGDDITLAIDLAAKCFGPNYYEAREWLWMLERLGLFKDVIVAMSGNKLIGVTRLVHKTLIYLDTPYKCVGLSTICVHPNFRGRHTSGDMIGLAREIAVNNKADFMFLYARRALDGFYGKYGFVGVGTYPRLTIKVPANESQYWREYKPSDLEQLKQGRCALGNLDGWQATAADWEIAARKKSIAFVLDIKGWIFGYALSEDGCLVGFYDASNEYLHSYGSIKHKFNFVSLPLSHPFMVQAMKMDHTLETRKTIDGGHMMLKLNKDMPDIINHSFAGLGAF